MTSLTHMCKKVQMLIFETYEMAYVPFIFKVVLYCTYMVVFPTVWCTKSVLITSSYHHFVYRVFVLSPHENGMSARSIRAPYQLYHRTASLHRNTAQSRIRVQDWNASSSQSLGKWHIQHLLYQSACKTEQTQASGSKICTILLPARVAPYTVWLVKEDNSDLDRPKIVFI